MELLSSFEWLEKPPMVEEIETIEEEELPEPQVWKDFEETTERFRKSLYYGKIPSSDRLSLPVTELCVAKFNTWGLEGLEKKLDRLNIDKAAEITRETCSSPTSLVLALMYLDRLRSSNPKYLSNISPTDLFLVSMMVASKFLHDDGEEDEVFNDEWATSGGMEKKELNELELNFLTAIDWRIYVSLDEYEETTRQLEWAVAVKQIDDRGGWTTYSDLLVLSSMLELIKIWEIIYEYTLKVTAVCAFAYAASLMTMMGTCQLLTSRSSGTYINDSMNNVQLMDYSDDWKASVRDTILRTTTQEIIAEDSETTDSETEIQFNERLSDLDFGNDTYAPGSNPTWGGRPLMVQPCPHQTSNHEDLLKEHEMMSRLTKALFALKIGTFRDLMLGPHIISGLGNV